MQPDSTSGAPLTPAIVFENLNAFQRTFALKAAIELDIFRAVGEGPGGVASIARHAKASERGIRILCDFLVINGLLQKVDGHYRHTPSSAAFLDPNSPACLSSIVGFLSLPELCQPYTSPKSCATAGPFCRVRVLLSPRIRCGWSSPKAWLP